MTDEDYPHIGCIVDNVYTLTRGLGKGGYARVYFAEVNLETFDYATVVAYREKREKKQAAGIAPSRGQHFEKIEKRLKELRRSEWAEKVKAAVEKVPDFYPFTAACAVKILDIPPDVRGSDRETRIERFEGEWKNLMGITHPNVIRVYGGGKTEIEGKETYYYAMEYLEDILDDEMIMRKTYEDKAGIIQKAAMGLRAIHSHQLVHRDVKPDNILVTRAGDVKVTDAGIAKDLMRDSDMTLTQAVIGTPHFESPEQVVGTKNVDFRTDIYSLGGSFYKYLTGFKPYEDNEELTSAMDILYVLRKLHDYASGIDRNVYRIPRLPSDIVLPSSVRNVSDVPVNVADVVEKMMNPDKDTYRHQTMDEVITDLNALLHGDATSIELERQEIASEKGVKLEKRLLEKRKHKRNVAVFAATGSVLAVVILLVIVGFFMQGSTKRSTPVDDPQQTEEQAEKDVSEEDTAPDVTQKALHKQLESLYNSILSREATSPEDYNLLEPLWRELLEKGKGTGYENIAEQKLAVITEKQKQAQEKTKKEIETLIVQLDTRVRTLTDNRKFGEALEACSIFQKEEVYSRVDVKAKVSLLKDEIIKEAEKAAGTLMEAALKLAVQGRYKEARSTVKILGSFGMPEYTALVQEKLSEIDMREQKAVREKEEEARIKVRELMAGLRPLIAARRFRHALKKLDESARDIPRNVADEYLKPERTILQAAHIFLTRCRNRAASGGLGLTLTVKGMKGTVSGYDPVSDTITVTFRGEEYTAQSSQVIRTLPADSLLVLSGWKNAGSLNPREAFAAGCFIMLADTYTKAKPYIGKAREGGLINAQIERSLTIREKGEMEVLAEEKFTMLGTLYQAEQWDKTKKICEDLLANYAEAEYLQPHLETVKQMLEKAEFELSPFERFTIVFQQGRKSPELGVPYTGAADTYLRKDNKGFGQADLLRSYKIYNRASQIMLFSFDLSMVPQDAKVEKAEFAIHCESMKWVKVELVKTTVYALTRSWDEKTAIWYFCSVKDGKPIPWGKSGVQGNRDLTADWGHGPNGIAGVLELEPKKTVSCEITPVVSEWVSDRKKNCGLYLMPGFSEGLIVVHSKESKQTELRPKLTVTFVSKPFTLMKR